MEKNNFTDQIKVKTPENIKEKSLKRRLGEFGIEVKFEPDSISLTTEKPLSMLEWQEILKNDLR